MIVLLWVISMKDYSNYCPTQRDHILNSGTKLFQLQLQGIEGRNVKIEGILTRGIIIDVSSNVYSKNNSSDEKKLLLELTENALLGNVVDYDDKKWIMTDFPDKTNQIHYVCRIRKCNLLPFYYKIDNSTYSTYGYYEKDIYINNDNDPIVLPNDVVMITIPRNKNTLKIDDNDKFYIFEDSWSEFYQVEGTNKSKIDGDKGLIIIRAKKIVKEGTPQEYYSLSPTPSTNIGEVIMNPKTLYPTLGDTPQLTCKVYDKNGILLPDEPVTWSSSSELIATVNQDGLVTTLKVGKCQIKATSDSDSTMFGVCELDVCSGGWF